MSKLDSLKYQLSAVSILNARTVYDSLQDETERINQYVSLTAFDLFTGIEATSVRIPFFSVVFTLWASILPAVGSGFLPLATRTSLRNSVLSFSQVPSSVHL